MKILFLVPYPLGEAPSQRFRFEQYFSKLASAGHTYIIHSFLTQKGWELIYSKGHTISKTLIVLAGFIRRLKSLAVAAGSDMVFIHREATPIGPPIFEWFIAKVLGKKIIYDFDDAIWMTDKNESAMGRVLRWRSKVKSIIRLSWKISCGNHYLCAYARRFNPNVIYNPTTIDTFYHTQTEKESNEIVIGWTGSHSTLKYLDEIVPVINHLEKKYPSLIFVVIANRMPTLPITSLRFVPWRRETEIEDLSKLDIGMMPLPNDDWARGKCGFKLLQYMALGIPSVASPVGVNTEIITDGVEGLVCNGTHEWIEAIEKLIADKGMRKRMADAGLAKVVKYYSVDSNAPNFLSLFGR